MSTRKKKKKRKMGKTRKRGGNRLTKVGVGALALSTLGRGALSKPTVQGNSVPTASLNFSKQSPTAFPAAYPKYKYDQGTLTFSGADGFTPIPTYGTAPYSFPQPNTSTAMDAVSPGMNLNPNKNYSVTVKSINNPSFGALGSVDPLTHHTLEVQEVNENNEVVGNPTHVGYYAKATPESVAKYNKKHPDRPKLNAHDIQSIMNPVGVPGQFQSPDAIIASGLASGKTLKTVGKRKIVSGENFNQKIGNSVNLNTKGKYSAPLGAIKEFLQYVAGNEEANSICGAGNCRSEAANVMNKFGGKRKKRNTKRKKKSHRKSRKSKRRAKRRTKRRAKRRAKRR